MIKLLPFSFSQNLSVDNALSTQQIIHQLITQMNDVVKYVTNWESDYQGYVDNKISELAADIEKKLKALDIELTTYIDDAIAKERQYVNTWNTNLQVQIDEVNRLVYKLIDESKVELKKLITDTSKSDRDYTDTKVLELKTIIAELNQKLDELASKSFASYSPRDGMLKSNQECFEDLSQLVMIGVNSCTWEYLEELHNKVEKYNLIDAKSHVDFNFDTIIYGFTETNNEKKNGLNTVEYLMFRMKYFLQYMYCWKTRVIDDNGAVTIKNVYYFNLPKELRDDIKLDSIDISAIYTN